MESFPKNGYLEDFYGLDKPDKSFKDYLRLIRNNLLLFIFITLIVLGGAVFYALDSIDIYSSETTLKINKSQGNILQSPLIPEFEDFGSDRIIANEIEILKSYKLRLRAANALIDSFLQARNKKQFYLVLVKDTLERHNRIKLHTARSIAGILSNVTIEQKKGLDIIEIVSESPSPYESALIGNIYANEYKNLNLEVNRNQLTFVKNFLNKQKDEKQNELKQAEDTLKTFQEKGGFIALDEQATVLIEELSNFEARKNAAHIELMASDAVLDQYKNELKKQDPGMADYLESMTSEAYITALQKQLAELQINKDLALANKNSRIDISSKVKEYDEKIDELKGKLNEKVNVIKAGIFASSPAQVKELSQKIIEEEVKNRSLKISINGLSSVVNRYEQKFNSLPKTSLQFARFQRNRESLEKLYTLVEEKYQEALINEQSQPGNVLIVDEAIIPLSPSKPNRPLIVLIGFAAGIFIAFGFLYVKEYFDNTVKSPDDIEKNNINVLGWVPHIKSFSVNGKNVSALISVEKPDSIQSESFRTIRTRIQFSRVNQEALKVILITSPAPQEGKTFITVNLAESFAQANKKTLILDCDLRKPRVHSVFQQSKSPGLIEYLFKKKSLDEIIRSTDSPNLSYITSGTIPPNPAEILVSEEMQDLINELKNRFDYVIVDSPPIIAVTDSEILSRLVDGTLLVVFANQTENEMMQRATDLIKNDNAYLIGTVLNNFAYKRGYGSYYKYYYYYSSNGTGKGKRRKRKEGKGEKIEEKEDEG